MTILDFTVEEISMISSTKDDTDSLAVTISKLKELLPHIDDQDIIRITESAIKKLSKLTPAEFDELYFEEF